MKLKRILRHLLTTDGAVRRAFTASALSAIESAITTSETSHFGQIRFAVEGALDGTALFGGQSSSERAIEVFSRLRVWDTEHNNGLLIYLLLADRAVEIVADRGIHVKVGSDAWREICSDMEAAFRQSNYESGVVAGVAAVAEQLANHFPASEAIANELSDAPVVLRHDQ
jgi:uncharacterized membrane protein